MWEPPLLYRLQLGTKLSMHHTAKLGQPTYPNTESVLPSLCGSDREGKSAMQAEAQLRHYLPLLLMVLHAGFYIYQNYLLTV